jgi:UDP-2,3-diacylglucosamine pyrophosphatase LpxH
MKWLESLQEEGEIEWPVATEVLQDNGKYKIYKGSKKLIFPDKLILNGDIFELWDASDQSILFASHSILNSISRLECDKVYLIGNHDFANSDLAEDKEGTVTLSNLYPWGLSDLKIIADTYPIPEGTMIKTLRVGKDHYLFLHGHQFSKSFRIAPWKIISSLRDGAETFRLYSWVLVGLWIIWIFTLPFTGYLQQSIAPFIQYGLGLPLTILALPRFFVSIARPIWNKFFGSRYDRVKARSGFDSWWKEFTKKKELQANRIHVIYGHTHTIDIQDREEKMVTKSIQEVNITLVNHPSWVKDAKDEHKYELREVFVYVDKYGFEFFGWRWDNNSPFHIPKSVVQTYASDTNIDDNTASVLSTINWPEKLIEELRGSKDPE